MYWTQNGEGVKHSEFSWWNWKINWFDIFWGFAVLSAHWSPKKRIPQPRATDRRTFLDAGKRPFHDLLTLLFRFFREIDLVFFFLFVSPMLNEYPVLLSVSCISNPTHNQLSVLLYTSAVQNNIIKLPILFLHFQFHLSIRNVSTSRTMPPRSRFGNSPPFYTLFSSFLDQCTLKNIAGLHLEWMDSIPISNFSNDLISPVALSVTLWLHSSFRNLSHSGWIVENKDVFYDNFSFFFRTHQSNAATTKNSKNLITVPNNNLRWKNNEK